MEKRVGTWEKIGDLKKWITNQNIEKAIYCTVGADLPKAIKTLIREKCPLLNLDYRTPLPIKNQYKTPKTLGKDRLAAIMGAHALYPDQAALVIDAGTCVTYDVLDNKRQYLGGNISPGWQMRLDAMEHFTAKLPRPETKALDNWLGEDTNSALQDGAYYGLLFEMQGYINEIKTKYPFVNVLLTGGDAEFFAKKLKSKIFVNQNLVLIGLNKTLHYNV